MTNVTSYLIRADQEIAKLKRMEELNSPPEGWVRTIRKSLGMSLRQLGRRMGITPQSVNEIEEREMRGSVSIRVLQQFGNAMDMKFVYGFVPREKSLEAMIDKRVREVADSILYKTSRQLDAGGKDVDPDSFLQAFVAKTKELKANIPSNLWD